jgi:hypothetical protein
MYLKRNTQGIIRKEYIYHHEPNIAQKHTLLLRKIEALVNQQTHERYPLHWVEIPLNKAQSYKFVYHESNKNGWNYFDRLVIYKLHTSTHLREKYWRSLTRKMDFSIS